MSKRQVPGQVQWGTEVAETLSKQILARAAGRFVITRFDFSGLRVLIRLVLISS